MINNIFRAAVTAAIFSSLCLTLLPPSYAADDADDAPITRREAAAILDELKKISATLERIEKQGQKPQRPAAPTTAAVSSKQRPTLGNKDAPVTIVEFSDYQCPYCKRFADNTLAQLKREYIDTGKVRLVFKDMPLHFHQHARKAAQAAHCAGEQGKYWPMHDLLFKNSKQLQEEKLPAYAATLKLDAAKFASCLSSKRHLAQIDSDIAEAQKNSITGTPTFVIGKTAKDLIKGDVVRGAQPVSSFKLHIDKHLKK